MLKEEAMQVHLKGIATLTNPEKMRFLKKDPL